MWYDILTLGILTRPACCLDVPSLIVGKDLVGSEAVVLDSGASRALEHSVCHKGLCASHLIELVCVRIAWEIHHCLNRFLIHSMLIVISFQKMMCYQRRILTFGS